MMVSRCEPVAVSIARMLSPDSRKDATTSARSSRGSRNREMPKTSPFPAAKQSFHAQLRCQVKTPNSYSDRYHSYIDLGWCGVLGVLVVRSD